MGLPVVASAVPSLSEWCAGKGSLPCEPTSVDQLCVSVCEILSSRETYDRLTSEIAGLDLPTWRDSARELIKKL